MNHLAILKQPFLRYIYEGKKPIESRATQVRCAPYGKVHDGDTIYFRESGDFAVTGRALVENVIYCVGTSFVNFQLQQYKTKICITDEYIASKSNAKYLTLIWLSNIEKIMPFPFKKRDQRAWIVDFQVPSIIQVLESIPIQSSR